MDEELAKLRTKMPSSQPTSPSGGRGAAMEIDTEEPQDSFKGGATYASKIGFSEFEMQVLSI